MVCPYWTSTLSYPIAIWDVVSIIKNCIEVEKRADYECINLCGPDALSYEEMMKALSVKLNRRHYFLPVPFVSPRLSKLWVRLITGAPRDLVYPLVDSLKTHMIPLSARPHELDFIKPMSFDEAITRSINQRKSGENPTAYSYHGADNDSSVRSVQRVTTLFRSEVNEVAQLYFKWLDNFLRPFIRVENNGAIYTVKLIYLKWPLLVFESSESRSFADRKLYYIRSGLLVGKNTRARLEFRNIYQGLYKIIAIHDYRPTLPWYTYKYTQALVHLFVMRSFGKFLIRRKL